MAMLLEDDPVLNVVRTDRRSLRDIAYERIKGMIISCELEPGIVISEAELSTALGIGRTPVHQALDRLMVDQFVEVMPRKGVIVRPLSLSEVKDINEVRLLNETYVAKLAAERITPSDVEAIRDNVKRMYEAARCNDLQTLIEIDREFHDKLASISRNPVLASHIRGLHDRMQRYWFVTLTRSSEMGRMCDQHNAVAEAVCRRDSDTAAAAMSDHIESLSAVVSRIV